MNSALNIPGVYGPMMADAYKTEHHRMYPAGMTRLVSNLTPRNSKFPRVPVGLHGYNGAIVFGGIQDAWDLEIAPAWQAWFDLKPIDAVKVVKDFLEAIGSDASRETLEKWAALHQLGHLPVEICALPTGTVVAPNTPVMQITNTDQRFAWLVNYLETCLSAGLWKTSTSATTAAWYKKLFQDYLEKTGGDPAFALWQGHDFSYRGLSNNTDAVLTGLGHLFSFFGSDSLPAIAYAKEVYHSDFVGGSVPATEHSVMTAGSKETEVETFRRLIQTYPSGVLSIVSDTWDYWKVLTEYAPTLKDEILARTPNQFGLAKVVFRPDSGDPETILCGEAREINGIAVHHFEKAGVEIKAGNIFLCLGRYYRITNVKLDGTILRWDYEEIPEGQVTPAMKGSLRILAETFGTTLTSTGHKLLNERVGLIYGDSITPERAASILKRMDAMGFCTANVVFGIGSYTYQGVTRDCHSFAMKATFCEINDEKHMLKKEPITDMGKASRTGILAVVYTEDGVPEVVEGLTDWKEAKALRGNLLQPVPLIYTSYEEVGDLDYDLDEIRRRIKGTSHLMFRK